MPIDLQATFEKFEDEFLRFERIESPLHPVRDLCGFLLLHSIAPAVYKHSGELQPIICASEHDEFFLATDCETLAANATEEQIRDLRRCGVMYDSENESLSMFS